MTIEPHHFLACPLDHERRLIDAEYPLRCQEWLANDEVLQTIHPLFGRPALCKCPPGTPARGTEEIERVNVVTHRVSRRNLASTVRFAYPLVICGRCGKPRSIEDDFVQCWERVHEP